MGRGGLIKNLNVSISKFASYVQYVKCQKVKELNYEEGLSKN